MSPDPLVSIVIATYRASGHLAEAIQSALTQSLTDIEVIVSDDGNSAAVAELVNSFNDSRLVYVANDIRLGPAGNHWRGFHVARGQFLAVLNHDDLLRPNFTKVLSEVMQDSENIVLAFCDHDVVDEAGQFLSEATERLSAKCGRISLAAGLYKETPSLVTRGTIPLSVGAMFRKSHLPELGGLEPGGAYDLYLSLRYAETGFAFYYVKERLAAWRRHQSQLTAKPDLMWARGSLACWELMSESAVFRGERKNVRRGVGRSRYRVARLALDAGDFLTARAMALRSAQLLPLNWRAWALLAIATIRQQIG